MIYCAAAALFTYSFFYSEYGEEFVDLTDLQNELGLNKPVSSLGDKMKFQLENNDSPDKYGFEGNGGQNPETNFNMKLDLNLNLGARGKSNKGDDKYKDFEALEQ